MCACQYALACAASLMVLTEVTRRDCWAYSARRIRYNHTDQHYRSRPVSCIAAPAALRRPSNQFLYRLSRPLSAIRFAAPTSETTPYTPLATLPHTPLRMRPLHPVLGLNRAAPATRHELAHTQPCSQQERSPTIPLAAAE